MNVLDLFSGIGGFSLGLERAGMRTVAFCETDPYCRRVLAKHWPDVPCYDDVRTLTAARLTADGIIKTVAQPDSVRCTFGSEASRRAGLSIGQDGPEIQGQVEEREFIQRETCRRGIDVICGGFPCQDISVAGKGAGIGGERSGLWSEYARIIGEVRPRYVIVENVAALLGRGLERVLGDLAALGFDAEWHCIPASYVGAPHRRDRLWIVAYPARDVRPEQAQSGAERQRTGASGQSVDVADTAGNRRPEGGAHRNGVRIEAGGVAAGKSIGSGPSLADANGEPSQRLAISWSECGRWLAEPDVGRVANGVPARVDRLRALGNAVVPQIPEIIGRAIMKADAAASYDGAHGHNDMAASWNACLAAVRERIANGGPGWEPKP